MKMLKMRDAVTETERNQKASPSSLLPALITQGVSPCVSCTQHCRFNLFALFEG